MKQSLKHFLVFLVWNVATSVVVLLTLRRSASPLEWGAGLAAVVALASLVLRRYVLRTGTPAAAERAVVLRLQPLPPATRRWVLLAAPVLVTLSWAMGEVYTAIVPVPPEALDPFGELLATPRGRLSIAVLAIGVAPVLEEFFFRGLIQHALERRFGAGAGILAASGLFALVHFLPWVLPLHFLLGAAFGYAVWATRSIWAGVILHAANNAVAMLLVSLREEEISATPTLWEIGLTLAWWTDLLILLVSAAVALWVARRLWDAGRPMRLRYG